jgi:hypothetical protein
MTAHAEAARKIEAKALRDAAADLLHETHATAHKRVCDNQYRSDKTSAHDALDVATEWLLARADALDSEVAR